MYRTHNDLVVRTVDVNEKPIQGVSVRVSKSKTPILDNILSDPTGILFRRQKRDLDYEEGVNFEEPVKEEGDSEVGDEADENNADGSRYILTDELGEATFPRHPVGSELVIEVKAKAG